MPTPVSVTTPDAPSGCGPTSTVTRPPGGVNLRALATRLATTCPMRGGSWRILTGAAGRRSVSSISRRGGGGWAFGGWEEVVCQPVHPLELLAARLKDLRPRLRVGPGPILEQLVER